MKKLNKNLLLIVFASFLISILIMACETPEMDLELQEIYQIEKDSIKEIDI